MTDHANELRRYARKIAHPAGDVPSVMLAAADEIERLAARLEATEEDRARFLVEMGRLCAQCDALRLRIKAAEKERDALRAELDALKSQEPVAWLIDWADEPDLGHYFSESAVDEDSGRSRPLFLHPVPASVPEDVMRDAERYRYLRARDDGTAGVGCWIEADGRVCDRGWLYGVQLDSAIDSFIEVLAAAPKPDAKP